MAPLISVIVPVYKAEKYLRRCLDSLLSQDIREEMEILTINDASPDNSLKILREYEELYPEIIKVVDLKSNQGVGIVRYIASKLSQGKYIGSMDSDDYLKSSHYFSRMINILEKEKGDVAITGFSISRQQLEGKEDLIEKIGIYNIEDKLTVFQTSEEIEKMIYFTSPMLWNKIFRRDLYVDGPFDSKIPCKTGEDKAVIPKLFFANKIVYVPSFDYIYDQREDSLCDFNNLNRKTPTDEFSKGILPLLDYISYENSLIDENHKPKGLNNFIENRTRYELLGGVNAFLAFNLSNRNGKKKVAQELFSYMKKNRIKIKDLFSPILDQRKVSLRDRFFICLAQLSSVFRYIFPTFTLYFLYFVRTNLTNQRLPMEKIKEVIKGKFPRMVAFYKSLQIMGIKWSLRLRKFSLIFKKREEIPVIVSLASYPGGGRHKTVYLTIQSILCQSVKPKKILLWLYEGEFPNKEKDLPKVLLNLQSEIFEIKWSQKNIKSYNKIMNTLEEYQNEIIVTADDDILYEKEWLERLWSSYLEFPEDVQAHRVTKFYKQNNHWDAIAGGEDIYNQPSFLHKVTGVGGVLYPVGSFYKDILKEELYMSLAPTNDDQWLWVMTILNNKRIKVVKNSIINIKVIPSTQEVALTNINDKGENLFWVQFNNLIKHYPKFENKLEEEVNIFKLLN